MGCQWGDHVMRAPQPFPEPQLSLCLLRPLMLLIKAMGSLLGKHTWTPLHILLSLLGTQRLQEITTVWVTHPAELQETPFHTLAHRRGLQWVQCPLQTPWAENHSWILRNLEKHADPVSHCILHLRARPTRVKSHTKSLPTQYKGQLGVDTSPNTTEL